MKKGLKKALVMLVSVTMVFTMMAMPVYADDAVIVQDEEAVASAEATGSYDAVEAATETATETAVEEPVIEEEPAPEQVPGTPAEEVINVPAAEENEVSTEPAVPAEPAEAEETTTEVSAEDPAEVIAAEGEKAVAEDVTLAITKLAAGNMLKADGEPEEETPSEIAYSGDVVKFCKEDGSEFGMFTRQEGSKEEIKDGMVEITFVPKNTTVYAGFHYGLITDENPEIDVELKDGKFTFSVPVSNCGKGIAVAPLKSDGNTTSSQYYLCIPAQDKIPVAEPEGPASEIAYSGDVVKFCKEDGETEFGMFTRQDSSKEEIKDGMVEITFVPKNTTVYGWFHYGLISDEELTKDVELKDGAFTFSVPVSYCGKGVAVAPIKKKDGATTGDQYYLCIPPQDKIPTTEPEIEKTNLAITNSVKMFKVVSAYITKDKGQEYLVVALNSTGYHELFKGTKPQAIANGDGTKDKGNDKWVHGYTNSEGKWEFKIPVSSGESYAPCVSISDSYYKDYLAGKGKLEDAFFPRQFKINRNAKTLLVEDYNASDDTETPDSDKPDPVKPDDPSGSGDSGSDEGYAPAVDSSTTLPDGEYTPDSFSWSGGSGRLAYIRCTKVTVLNGQAYATIEFGSSSYDAVRASGGTYYKQGGGNSVFTIPVNLNANNTIYGRTTAMSQAHWVEYTIYVGLAENEADAGKAEEARKDAAEAKTKLMDKAPTIAGLEAEEGEEEVVEHSELFKIFNYKGGVKLISVDVSKDTALLDEYTENAKKAMENSESEDAVEYDEEGKAIAKSKADIIESMYKNNVVNYLLVPEDFEVPAGLDKEYIIVTVPSEKSFMASPEAIAIMEELGCLDAISLLGIDEKDVKSDELKKAIKDEKVKLAGNTEKFDYAKVVKDKSDLAVLPGSLLPEEIKKDAKDKDKLEKEAKEKQEALEKIESRFTALEVPVIIDRSAAEEDELAKAEWIKVYGALYGCEDKAQEIFDKKVKEAEKNGKK